MRPSTGRVRHAAILASWVIAGVTIGAGCVATPPIGRSGPEITVPTTLVTQKPINQVEQAMIRFRNISCEGVSVGSGFAIDPHRIVTNRHVAGGADELFAETWDGRKLHVTDTKISPDNDLAVVTVSDTLTHTLPLAKADPVSHLNVSAVGYPLGRALRADDGSIIETVTSDLSSDDALVNFGEPRAVMFNARIRHGNSGGPLVNEDGTVVGIVYRVLSLADDTGLAIPVSSLHKVLDDNDLVANPDCETFVEKYGGG